MRQPPQYLTKGGGDEIVLDMNGARRATNAYITAGRTPRYDLLSARSLQTYARGKADALSSSRAPKDNTVVNLRDEVGRSMAYGINRMEGFMQPAEAYGTFALVKVEGQGSRLIVCDTLGAFEAFAEEHDLEGCLKKALARQLLAGADERVLHYVKELKLDPSVVSTSVDANQGVAIVRNWLFFYFFGRPQDCDFTSKMLTKEMADAFIEESKYLEVEGASPEIWSKEKEKPPSVICHHLWSRKYHAWLRDNVIPLVLERVKEVASQQKEDDMELLREEGMGAVDIKRLRLEDLEAELAEVEAHRATLRQRIQELRDTEVLDAATPPATDAAAADEEQDQPREQHEAVAMEVQQREQQEAVAMEVQQREQQEPAGEEQQQQQQQQQEAAELMSIALQRAQPTFKVPTATVASVKSAVSTLEKLVTGLVHPYSALTTTDLERGIRLVQNKLAEDKTLDFLAAYDEIYKERAHHVLELLPPITDAFRSMWYTKQTVDSWIHSARGQYTVRELYARLEQQNPILREPILDDLSTQARKKAVGRGGKQTQARQRKQPPKQPPRDDPPAPAEAPVFKRSRRTASRGVEAAVAAMKETAKSTRRGAGRSKAPDSYDALGFLDKRTLKNGKRQYFVNWLSYAPTWEDAELYDDKEYDDWKEALELTLKQRKT